ncbi:MAG TPA: hypothetical protein PJ982_12090, partial [Lacipirellulaceae bacterium]|nr:hypothetical protein [Lacipirellulaceae bacterium]
ATVLVLSQRHGMIGDRGAWLLAMSPAALGFGVAPAAAAVGVLVVAAASTNLVFTSEERRELAGCVREVVGGLAPLLFRPRTAS